MAFVLFLLFLAEMRDLYYVSIFNSFFFNTSFPSFSLFFFSSFPLPLSFFSLLLIYCVCNSLANKFILFILFYFFFYFFFFFFFYVIYVFFFFFFIRSALDFFLERKF